MKITIHIEDATIDVLKAIAEYKNTNNVSEFDEFFYPGSEFTIPKFEELTAEPPVKLKKDGTPAKKRGRPAGTTNKKRGRPAKKVAA